MKPWMYVLAILALPLYVLFLAATPFIVIIGCLFIGLESNDH